MGLNANGQRTLAQVKTGLCMLYGAEYFTEDEWIKIDGLIHKGKYEFTNGPPKNHLEEELMSFEDDGDITALPAPAAVPALPVPFTAAQDLFLDTEHLSPVDSEKPSIDLAIVTPIPDDISPNTSLESATDDASSAVSPVKETSTPALAATAAPSGPIDGLKVGYTQAQLNEVRAFNAGLTKAGKKGRPQRYQVVEEEAYPSPAWSEHGESGLPTAAEQESRIYTWADEVDKIGPVAVPEISPSRSPSTPVPVVVEQIPKLVEQFVQIHGRPPRSANDLYQPNNPQHNARAASRSSSGKDHRVSTPKTQRKFFATAGSVFRAYSAAPKRSNMGMDVAVGDQITYLKHVSGITHTGINLRTKDQGQFPESVLEPTQEMILEQQRAPVRGHQAQGRGRGTSISTVSNALDKVEALNAAEWDRESVSSARPTTAGGPPARTFGGLAGSRFATLTDSDVRSLDSTQSPSFTQADIRQIIREELAQSPSAQAQVQRLHKAATPHEGALTKVIPKTNTCWFWKNKNDCRFTAEECRDLHADLPPLHGEPTNLRGGRPTWGSLADALPPSTPTGPANSNTPNIDFKLFSKSKTCYYWATDGKCANTAEDCKYLHEYTAAGVATRPGGYAHRKKDFNWHRKGHTDTVWSRNTLASPAPALASTVRESAPTPDETPIDMTGTEGWAVPAEQEETLIQTSWGVEDLNEDHLNNPNAAIWGAVEGSSAWDTSGDSNKPAHVKAMEERQRIEAVGW